MGMTSVQEVPALDRGRAATIGARVERRGGIARIKPEQPRTAPRRWSAKTIWITTVGAIIVATVGCSKDTRIAEMEHAYRTGGWNLSTFHRVLDGDKGLSFHFPGFLVGVEKAKKEKIGFNRTQIPLDTSKLDGVDNQAVVKGYLDDPKGTFISHLVEYLMKPVAWGELQRIEEDIFLNAYKGNSEPAKAFVAGLKAVRKSMEPSDRSSLAARIGQNLAQARDEKRPYTHILLYAMGWNTDEQETIRNINSLVTHLDEQRPTMQTFKPLIVAVAWPSEWSWPICDFCGKLVSYPVKTDDADEVGLIWANLILRNILVPAKHTYGIPLILIGHSFGARLLTRAAMSAKVITSDAVRPDDIDLIVGLQGAFSVNRFIPESVAKGGGREGAPYEDFANIARNFVFTWSRHDRANPAAAWITGAKHIGGEAGERRSKDFPDIFAHFIIEESEPCRCHPIKIDPIDPNEKRWKDEFADQKRIIMVDASAIVKFESHGHAGKAHNDVYTPEIAQLIWRSIEALQ